MPQSPVTAMSSWDQCSLLAQHLVTSHAGVRRCEICIFLDLALISTWKDYPATTLRPDNAISLLAYWLSNRSAAWETSSLSVLSNIPWSSTPLPYRQKCHFIVYKRSKSYNFDSSDSGTLILLCNTTIITIKHYRLPIYNPLPTSPPHQYQSTMAKTLQLLRVLWASLILCFFLQLWPSSRPQHQVLQPKDVGLFNPDVSDEHGLGPVAMVFIDTVYRDIYTWVDCLRDLARTNSTNEVKQVIQPCLRGGAGTWWIVELTDKDRKKLRNANLEGWFSLLIERFKMQQSVAIKSSLAHHTPRKI